MRIRRNILAFFVASVLICWCLLVLFSPVHADEAPRVDLLQDREYFPEVLRLIGNASNTLNICMFQIVYYPQHPGSPSNQLLNALIEAHRRGVAVRVVLDDGGTLSEVAKSNNQSAVYLKQAGVPVFFDCDAVTTHTKFLVIDDAVAVLGSTNWTYSALSKNHELSAVIHCRETARRMNRYFEQVLKAGRRL